jgi:hypothetical protein
MKIKECAEFVKKSPRTLHKKEWKERLGAFLNGGELNFPRQVVEDYMESLARGIIRGTSLTPFQAAMARRQARSLKNSHTDSIPISLKKGVG